MLFLIDYSGIGPQHAQEGPPHVHAKRWLKNYCSMCVINRVVYRRRAVARCRPIRPTHADSQIASSLGEHLYGYHRLPSRHLNGSRILDGVSTDTPLQAWDAPQAERSSVEGRAVTDWKIWRWTLNGEKKCYKINIACQTNWFTPTSWRKEKSCWKPSKLGPAHMH